MHTFMMNKQTDKRKATTEESAVALFICSFVRQKKYCVFLQAKYFFRSRFKLFIVLYKYHDPQELIYCHELRNRNRSHRQFSKLSRRYQFLYLVRMQLFYM